MKPSCCIGLDVLLGHDLIEEDAYDQAEIVGAFAPGKTYLTMHIENPKGLVEKDKGAGLAWATNMLVPEFIEKTIYDKVKEQLQTEFKAKGSDLSVEIVTIPPKGSKPTSDLPGGIFLGVLLSALGYGAVKLATKVF